MTSRKFLKQIQPVVKLWPVRHSLWRRLDGLKKGKTMKKRNIGILMMLFVATSGSLMASKGSLMASKGGYVKGTPAAQSQQKIRTANLESVNSGRALRT